jgi:hypothetical protein
MCPDRTVTTLVNDRFVESNQPIDTPAFRDFIRDLARPNYAVAAGPVTFPVHAVIVGGPHRRPTIVSGPYPGGGAPIPAAREAAYATQRGPGHDDQASIPATAVAEAIDYAISQPLSVDVNELIVRPTAQG